MARVQPTKRELHLNYIYPICRSPENGSVEYEWGTFMTTVKINIKRTIGH